MFLRKMGWLFLSVLALLTISAATAWARTCSLETVKGTYGFLEQGTIVAPTPGFAPFPTPYAAVLTANATFDGAGHFSGIFTASFGGFIVPGTFTGTYDVTTDCTYSDTFVPVPTGRPPQNVALHHFGSITGEGMVQELHYIYSDPGTEISGTGKKTPGSCSLESLKGTYALFGHGAITAQFLPSPPAPIPVVQAGSLVFDGKGSFSGTDTASTAGMVESAGFDGSYTVSRDCTASATINTILGPITEDGVITGEGNSKEWRGIFTSLGWAFVELTKKQ